ncbi:cellulose binding domain-containing protein [Actinomadura mexicana]|uniref:Cellulose binding domain-containing protein n=1 Tax=Actinomadura mexicana TaxID=134959 RepID=A0A238Z1A2_9ACTN|nr:cellulose binding domain-containing protein [Actinomadura mexicana]SNR77137.1 Cellulose binding domain-containing protein [Actinomadura mexicana]
MSGEDSGYVPPDHKTTAEFGVTRKSAAPGEPALPGTAAEPAVDDDLVDDLFDGDATTHDVPQAYGVGFQDLPSDDPEDDLETTYQDGSGDEPEDDFDTTLQDGPPDIAFQKQPPADTVDELDMTAFQAPVTFADIPMEQPSKPAPVVPPQAAPAVPPPAQPAAFEHGANPAPVYAQPPAPYQERVPEPAPFPEQMPPSEQAPPAQVAAQAAAPMPAEAPWTEQFASGEEAANRAGSGPAFAYGMPGAPPPAQSTMPPHHEATVPPMPPPAMVSPSGGLPGGPPAGPPPSRSRRPVILILLIALVVVLVLVGVVVLLLGRGSESGGKTAPQASPAGSTPATEGGGATPASPGAPSPGGGAPATPPQSGVPTNQPPGGQQPGVQPGAPPPVTTAPIGPLVQGKGITYQLVQQDSGYFEGKMVITNRTKKPLKAWKVTFKAPGADVKNIWGARLVHGGSTVEIRNLDGVPAIQPGATWDIQFGAAGAASTPKSCELNGRACGF